MEKCAILAVAKQPFLKWLFRKWRMKGILMRLFIERFITLFIVALRNFFAGISLSQRYVASSGIIPESILRGGQHCKMRIETTGNGNT